MIQNMEKKPYITDFSKEPSKNDPPYGFWISCNVMQSLPILPGVKTMYIKDVESALKDKTVYGYGFPLRVKDIQITSDGIYILYEILEEDRAFGQIEYYYSIKDQKFSYREIVSPLLGNQGCDSIFIFELLGVPVKKTFGGYSFKVGSLYKNGSKFNFYDFQLTDREIPKIDKVYRYIERDIQMNYKDNEVNANTRNYGEIPLDKAIDVRNRREALNIDATKEFLKQFFDSPILTKENLEYNTIEDFNKTELVKTNESIKKDYTDLKILGFPNSFNLNSDHNIAASINTDNIDFSNLYNYFGQSIVVDSFNDCGYKATKIEVGDDDSKRINILDAFVISMFEKLELNEYVNERKELLADSYKNPY